ncbi:MAG: hypothetical protein KC620_14845 [Myxococcales bacterium]|nr:hypothetical protein [Myxococcales bacterium]
MSRGALLARILFGSALLALAAPAGAAEFTPRGQKGLLRLLGESVDADAVRAAVARDGFSAEDPLGAAPCARCHPDVAAAWSSSAHRFASFNNPYYAAAVRDFRAEKGTKTAAFCAACHDPALLLSDGFGDDLDEASPAAQVGLSCLLCHSITDVPHTRGNGEYRVELTDVPRGKGHRGRLRPPLLGAARFCSTCHQVALTEEVTGDRWLRGQDDFDAWYDSSATGRGAGAIWRAARPRTCIDCHMPRVAASPREKGARDGLILDHRFLGANSALPHLRGDAAQLAATADFLRGVASIALAQVRPGEVDVVLVARRVGHRLPGGVNDANQVWIEWTALAADGTPLDASGHPAADGRLGPDTHLIRGQPADAQGLPLARRDVQNQRGAVFDTSLRPLDPQAVRFALPPDTAAVRARLLTRQFSIDYAAYACAALPAGPIKDRCLAPPVIEIARAEAKIDAAGHLHITGRLKEIIIRNGTNIFAPDVDRALAAHPAIDASKTIGVRDALVGERVVAAVVFKPGPAPADAELRAFVAERLSRHLWPDAYAPVGYLPAGAAGKVSTNLLRKVITGELADEIVTALGSWRFKRAQPSDAEAVKARVQAALTAGRPIDLLAYWGYGPRAALHEVDVAALDRLRDFGEAARRVPQAPPRVTIILTDMHAANNGIPAARVAAYSAAIQAEAEARGMQVVRLSEIWRDAGLTPAAITAHIETEAFAAEWQAHPLRARFVDQAARHAEHGDAEAAARFYVHGCDVEGRAIAAAYPNALFTTYNHPDFDCVSPPLPKLYLHSFKEGTSVKPWFVDAEEARP